MVNITVRRWDSSPVNIFCVTNQVKLSRHVLLLQRDVQGRKRYESENKKRKHLLKDRYEKLLWKHNIEIKDCPVLWPPLNQKILIPWPTKCELLRNTLAAVALYGTYILGKVIINNEGYFISKNNDEERND